MGEGGAAREVQVKTLGQGDNISIRMGKILTFRLLNLPTFQPRPVFEKENRPNNNRRKMSLPKHLEDALDAQPKYNPSMMADRASA